MVLRTRLELPEDLFPGDPWSIESRGYTGEVVQEAETIFALANGYLGLRGSHEENHPAVEPGTYLNGGTWPSGGGEQPLVHIVTGRFLVGAILWPHEEYVEQFIEGTLAELTDQHKVPVYWFAEYRLFIPVGYGDPNDTDHNGKALVIHGKGGNRVSDPSTLPPWLSNQLSSAGGEVFESSSWTYQAGLQSAVRLGVPVMQLTQFPDPDNTWRKVGPNNPKDLRNNKLPKCEGVCGDEPIVLV